LGVCAARFADLLDAAELARPAGGEENETRKRPDPM
jgi:hypothetical protein